jgi:hypothetical protein
MTAASGESKTPQRETQILEPEGRIPVTSSAASHKGTLTIKGDRATIAFERRIRHPVQAVWEALTEPEHLARWYMTTAQLD